ncbi:hypothetical protein ElyMa_003816500, partial [Elysia marginata]
MNTNGQMRIPGASSTIILSTVDAAMVTPSTPLDARGYGRLNHPPGSNDDQWKPVLAKYSENPHFKSVRDLCDGEVLFSQGDREYYENLKQQLEQESKSKKEAIEKLRRRKIRDVYKALSRACRLSESLSDEEISKKVCKLITSNKIEISVGGKVSVVKSVVDSKPGIHDFGTNTGEGIASASTAGKETADNSEDKERSVKVPEKPKSQA